jgi:hypothetical protein
VTPAQVEKALAKFDDARLHAERLQGEIMKRFLKRFSTLLVVVFATAAQAQLTPQAKEYCESVSGLAYSIMSNRQSGVAMSEVLKVDKDDDKVFQHMVLEAYKSPRYVTPEVQMQSKEDFRDKWHLRCVRSLMAKR